MKAKCIVIICLLCVLLIGCGNRKEYYKNTGLEKLETFTSITGMELTSSQVVDNNTVYNYILGNDAAGMGAISKWEQYVLDYGFEYVESLSGNGMSVFTKDKYCLCLFFSQPTDYTIQYCITVPILDVIEGYGSSADEQEEDYNKIVQLVEDDKYQDAMDFYSSSSLSDDFEGYSDSKKYYFYSMAMLDYENGLYGEARDMLSEQCNGFLDSDNVVKEIDKKIKKYNGVFKSKSVDYDMFVVINNGMVSFEFNSDYFSSGLTYVYSLKKHTFTTGEEAMAICDANGKVQYIISNLQSDNSGFLVAAPVGSTYTTFSGAYTKTNHNIPKKK